MRTTLAIAALTEAATGLALLAFPSIPVRLLFGTEISGVGVATTRVAGISLIALGLSCWPSGTMARAFMGMLAYSSLAALYLAYLGFTGTWKGPLLWPAVAAHAVISSALLWARRKAHAV